SRVQKRACFDQFSLLRPDQPMCRVVFAIEMMMFLIIDTLRVLTVSTTHQIDDSLAVNDYV
ncbi:MAG: hypothetical protein NT047_06560, partial [Deltaproteobacteria bacterium]|nr:hypothetical protein [Deltaproteobacteria bacterium]